MVKESKLRSCNIFLVISPTALSELQNCPAASFGNGGCACFSQQRWGCSRCRHTYAPLGSCEDVDTQARKLLRYNPARDARGMFLLLQTQAAKSLLLLPKLNSFHFSLGI